MKCVVSDSRFRLAALVSCSGPPARALSPGYQSAPLVWVSKSEQSLEVFTHTHLSYGRVGSGVICTWRGMVDGVIVCVCVCVRVYECVAKIKHWPWACVCVCVLETQMEMESAGW